MDTSSDLDFPDIPIRRYDIKSQDYLYLDNKQRTIGECYGAGSVMIAKVIHALENWHSDQQIFTHDKIAKVGNLVERNCITYASSQIKDFDDKVFQEDAPEIVEEMFGALLSTDAAITKPRSRDLKINSNELVLMVNFAFPYNPAKHAFINHITDTVVSTIQQKHNLWPVRVYAGIFNALDAHLVFNEFSITLLNVVNTELGGPSMTQLLDEPCTEDEWVAYAVRRETWNGRDLIHREDLHPRTGGEDDHASECSITSVDDGESAGSVAAEDHVPIEEAEIGPSEGALTTGRDTVDSLAEDLEVAQLVALHAEEVDAGTTPARELLVEQREPEEDSRASFAPPERSIDHPTWERPHDSTSLLDMIRSQASLITPLGSPASRAARAKDEVATSEEEAELEPEAAPKAPTNRSKTSGEDDFVVV
jgi:hypothetical protein